MDLILVESATKAKKIQSYLGDNYKVVATNGHFRDLPNNELGVDVDNGFFPTYEMDKKKTKLIRYIKKTANSADTVYLAADPDREGEAIAYHCKEVLKIRNPKRIVFREISKKAVENALKNPSDIDMKLVASQEARRVLDRLFGYIVSPILCNQSGLKLSAGRVQSPTLKIIAMRDKQIKEFVPSDYYELTAQLEGVTLNCVNTNLIEKGHITDKSIFEDIIQNTTSLTVSTHTENPKTIKARPCFTTSRLQQTASSVFKFEPKKTMEIAQKLFENGLITYHRTDSPNMSSDKFLELKDFLIEKGYEARDEQLIHKTKEDDQLAHEAISPTDFTVEELLEDGFNDDEKKLYKLIYERALLSGLEDGEDVTCKLSAVSDYKYNDKVVEFVLNDTQVTKEGWRKHLVIEKKSSKQKQTIPPNLKEVYGKTEFEFDVATKKTKAPPRYKSADLIQVLEKLGIGRPSTYASIIDNLFQREYVKDNKGFLEITNVGLKVVDAINDLFFMNLKFTQLMEQKLDEVSKGEVTYLTLVEENYRLLEQEKEKINYKK